MKNINKTLKLSAFLAIAFLLTTVHSCTKKETVTVTVAKEYPYKRVIQTTLPVVGHKLTEAGGKIAITFGIYFKPRIVGKVTELSCLMPDNGIYSVVLWDSATSTILANENITQSDTFAGGSRAITPVELSTNKTYILTGTVVNQKWWSYTRTQNGVLAYPFVSDLISITGYKWANTTAGAEPIIPNLTTTSDIAGFADFTYVIK